LTKSRKRRSSAGVHAIGGGGGTAFTILTVVVVVLLPPLPLLVLLLFLATLVPSCSRLPKVIAPEVVGLGGDGALLIMALLDLTVFSYLFPASSFREVVVEGDDGSG